MLAGLKSLDEKEAKTKASTSTQRKRVEMEGSMQIDIDNFMIAFLRNAFFRRNAALGLAQPTPWRQELAKKLEVASWRKQAEELIQWTLVEAVSEASHFTAGCPLELKGSGRWHANDGGGRYRILRSLVLQAFRSLHFPNDLDPEVELASLLYIATGEIPWRPEIDRLLRAIKTAFLATVITIGCKTVRFEIPVA
jgi:hypothetical protein